MSDEEFGRRARAGSGRAKRKQNEVERRWAKVTSGLAAGASLKSIYRELSLDGYDVGCFTSFRNAVRALQGKVQPAGGTGVTCDAQTSIAPSDRPQPFMGDDRFEGY